MGREERPGFMIYYETLDALDEYTEAETGQFVRAAGNYARTGALPEFEDRGLRGLWRLVQPKLDRDDSSYSEKCRKNRYNSYVSAEKRAYRKRFPGKPDPVEGVDFMDFDSWAAMVDEPNASDRFRPEPNASELKPTTTTTRTTTEPQPEPQHNHNWNRNHNESENQRGEPGGGPTTQDLYSAWAEAMKKGDKLEASRLDNELLRRGIKIDPITGEILNG